MMALSLWQFWASLIAVGAKKIETRGWPTPYRGPLIIHAAKRPLAAAELQLCREEPFRSVLKAHFKSTADLPFGAALCLVDLVAVKSSDILRYTIGTQEEAFGDYSPGRFGWVLENLRPFVKPVPCKGKQGLWQYTGEVPL